MKITTTEKGAIGSKYVPIAFEDREGTLLRERDGVQTLVVARTKKMSARTFRTMIRMAVRAARQHKFSHIAIDSTSLYTEDIAAFFTREEMLKTLAENAIIAGYEYTRYKTLKKDRPIQDLIVTNVSSALKKHIETGVIVGTYVNHARDMANTPGGDMTPRVLARNAQTLARTTKVTVKILQKAEIVKLKMGALLGVSKGSLEDPRFIIMEYWGAGRSAKTKKQSGNAIDENNPIVFVGKGITFDTGGLNLKSSDSVLDMHMDMSGGASVIAAIVAASQLQLKKNIVALIPAAENMVSGESYRPGDVLTTMSGKTVDVLNTDAEGRLVLADALTYAERYTPRLVVDVATLTGAALGALGLHASAIMTKDATIETRIRELGEKSGDYVWPLPLWDEYKQYTKGAHGDIANIPMVSPRYGGAINGGMFLSHFTEKYPWVHIDMAPRMTSAPGDYLAKGAAGEPVRLLLAIAEHF